MECTAIVLDRTEIVFAEAQNQSASGSRSEAMGINEGSSSGSLDGHSGQCPSEIGNDTSNCVTKNLILLVSFWSWQDLYIANLLGNLATEFPASSWQGEHISKPLPRIIRPERWWLVGDVWIAMLNDEIVWDPWVHWCCVFNPHDLIPWYLTPYGRPWKLLFYSNTSLQM